MTIKSSSAQTMKIKLKLSENVLSFTQTEHEAQTRGLHLYDKHGCFTLPKKLYLLLLNLTEQRQKQSRQKLVKNKRNSLSFWKMLKSV